jgi:hypothetical protein
LPVRVYERSTAGWRDGFGRRGRPSAAAVDAARCFAAACQNSPLALHIPAHTDAAPGPGSKRQAAEAAAGGAEAATEPAEEDQPSDFKRFCQAWAWKREHRPDRDRFHRSYEHEVGGRTLVIRQSKFNAEGFAST